MEAIKIIFFLLLFLTVYSYVVYPLVLVVLGKILRKDVRQDDWTPRVTLLISVYNEERVIRRKMENSLQLDYPRESLEILVISDHSTDGTEGIVSEYLDRGVTLLARPERAGKTAGLNEAVKVAKGEILVFSDADAMYEPDAIRKMVRVLYDKEVGLVTGSTRYISEDQGRMAETSGIYTALERFIKRHESRIGSCVGADGAIFAMRKSLYAPLRADDINDLVIPLVVVQKGARVVLHDDLYCSECASSDSASEFRRQVRITNRTLKALFRYASLMNVLRYPAFGFEMISHKILRFSVPIFLAALIPLNVLLAAEGPLYGLLLLGQAGFYGAAAIGYSLESTGKTTRFGLFYHFVVVNISVLSGWYKFLSGETQVTWNTR